MSRSAPTPTPTLPRRRGREWFPPLRSGGGLGWGRAVLKTLISPLPLLHRPRIHAVRKPRQRARQLAQLAALDLLRCRQRQSVDKRDITRRLVVRELRQRVLDDAGRER